MGGEVYVLNVRGSCRRDRQSHRRHGESNFRLLELANMEWPFGHVLPAENARV